MLEKAELQLQDKYLKLRQNLFELLEDGLVLAYSGGVDSAFLLWVACDLVKNEGYQHLKLQAILADSASLADEEKEHALWFAKQVGAPLEVLSSFELDNPAYTANDQNRCYHCKTELFQICNEFAVKQKMKWLVYGYNFSDQGDVRPGHLAAKEFGVRSPLFEAELTKKEIREIIGNKMGPLAQDLSDKPSSPCLSSRVMRGVSVTPEKLRDIDFLETFLRKKGLREFRVRLHEQMGKKFLRLEVAASEMEAAFHLRSEFLLQAKTRGYQFVTLDLEGYRMGGGVG